MSRHYYAFAGRGLMGLWARWHFMAGFSSAYFMAADIILRIFGHISRRHSPAYVSIAGRWRHIARILRLPVTPLGRTRVGLAASHGCAAPTCALVPAVYAFMTGTLRHDGICRMSMGTGLMIYYL